MAIREGGTTATLKGIQFNSFGAFFSRAYRENDYLWGRLHGADRLIDITVSTLPEGPRLVRGWPIARSSASCSAPSSPRSGPADGDPGPVRLELEREIG